MPKRTAKYLTEPTIGRIRKPSKGKRKEVSDSDAAGLALRISDRGARSWSVYFHLADASGRRKHLRMTLGRFPSIGIAEARAQARAVREQAAVGIDPRKAREQGKLPVPLKILKLMNFLRSRQIRQSST